MTHQVSNEQEDKAVGIIRANADELSQKLGLHVDFEEFYAIMKANCFGNKNPSHAQMSAFMVLANQYKLNPLTKEIYAFPSGGGITPIIGIDGWYKIAHSSGKCTGITHEFIMGENNQVIAIKCRVSRSDFDYPTETIEFMEENNTRKGVWSTRPIRMLKHRATAQAIRMAFNVNAMLDDEFKDMSDNRSSNSDLEEKRADIVLALESDAQNGVEALTNAFNKLPLEDRQALGSKAFSELQAKAKKVEVLNA